MFGKDQENRKANYYNYLNTVTGNVFTRQSDIHNNFYFTNIPLYLAVIFGGIALATAPAPALSVVREFKTDGPVTKTLIPMAALDDMVGVVVFLLLFLL